MSVALGFVAAMSLSGHVQFPAHGAVENFDTARSAKVVSGKAVESRYVFETYERAVRPHRHQFLNLQTGRFVDTAAAGDIFWSDTTEPAGSVVATNIALVAVDAAKWNASSPEEIIRVMRDVPTQASVRLGGASSAEISTPTWFYRTMAGRFGVLQRKTDKADSGLVHYRIIRPRREFTPLKSATLSLTGPKRFLKLDDGKIYSDVPTNLARAFLTREQPTGDFTLMVENIHNYKANPKGANLWETLSAEDNAQPAGLAALPFERTGFHRLREDDLPATVLIPQWGLLRATRLDKDTGNVDIEFKQVQPDVP